MKILVVGLGSIGSRHLSNLLGLGYKNIILYRTKKSVMQNISRFSSLPVYHDIDDALTQKPDVAIIANPTSLHVNTALKCAKAGCDLFIEKPLSHNLFGLRELDSLADRKGLVTFIGCQFRFHPHLQAIKKWIDDGTLGKVIYVSARWAEYLPDWHPWEDYRKGYSASEKLGGGVILTLIHPIDYLYWFFGNTSDIICRHEKISSLDTKVEDLTDIILNFRKKIIGHIHLDYFQRPRVHDLLIVGEKKRIYWNCHEGILSSEDRNGRKRLWKEPAGFERNSMFINELKHFMFCARKRRQTRIPLKEGIEVLKIALKAKERGRKHAR
ncbi:MAG: Gfo/Idh/MocA family oxidoreductase [Candidatus Omnitrophota bacterium]